MKKKKILIGILSTIIVALLSLIGLFYAGIINIDFLKPDTPAPIIEITPVEKKVQPQRKLWLDNKQINDDYQGEIVFESGLINQPFVQAKDTIDKDGNMYHFYTENGRLVTDDSEYTGNDVYIWTNWKDMTYDYNILGGSVFMDYRNALDDQNVVIYGHHFSVGGGNDPERIKAFTPLEQLLEEANYKGNERLDMILDNETRKYELVCVYQFDINDDFYYDNCQYWRTQYDYDDYSDVVENDYYQTYIDSIKKVQLYDTGVELTTNDKTLTLQTCIGGHAGELYEILVYKLAETQYFED